MYAIRIRSKLKASALRLFLSSLCAAALISGCGGGSLSLLGTWETREVWSYEAGLFGNERLATPIRFHYLVTETITFKRRGQFSSELVISYTDVNFQVDSLATKTLFTLNYEGDYSVEKDWIVFKDFSLLDTEVFTPKHGRLTGYSVLSYHYFLSEFFKRPSYVRIDQIEERSRDYILAYHNIEGKRVDRFYKRAGEREENEIP